MIKSLRGIVSIAGPEVNDYFQKIFFLFLFFVNCLLQLKEQKVLIKKLSRIFIMYTIE